MTWVLLEGIDRSGKSTIANLYKEKGYEIIHMDAPNKKYYEPGYSGPSYLEEIVEMYSVYSGKDVVFDRSPYGECIWSEIFNRQALLNSEDFEYLQKIEYNNNTIRYLMFDEDVEAHWQRCIDNKEPINRLQFIQTMRLYDELAIKYNFEKKQLRDFDIKSEERHKDKISFDRDTNSVGDIRSNTRTDDISMVKNYTLEQRLERANAIRSLLKSPLVKKKGEVFRELEQSIKLFLEQELESIFSKPKENDFTQDEVQILKIYAQRIKEKMG